MQLKNYITFMAIIFFFLGSSLFGFTIAPVKIDESKPTYWQWKAEHNLKKNDALDRGVVSIIVKGKGWGSAFFIDHDILVTAKHVVEDNADGNFIVRGYGQDKDGIAKVIAMSPSDDVAILRLVKKGDVGINPHIFKLREKKVDKYEVVYTYGFGRYPMSIIDLGTPHGARGLIVDPEFTTFKNIYHSAAISPGHSGSPLLDANGDVIGISNATTQRTHLGTDQDDGYIKIAYQIFMAEPVFKITELLKTLEK